MEISKQSRIYITKGLLTDYAKTVAGNNDLNVDELIIILKEIANEIK